MWRAFFFAVGTMLIILGVECLIVDSFVVQKARIPAIVGKVLDGASKTIESEGKSLQSIGGSNSASNGSPFGTSRFSDSFSNPSQNSANYYGGVPANNPAGSNSGFSLAGFGQQQNGIAPLTGTQRNGSEKISSMPTRIIQPKDWMPWSLLAAGTIVVLYTNTTSGRAFSGGE